jgi:CheY-like chemotaxis protein
MSTPYEIDEAPSGAAAIELIRQRSFDIVVTDVKMESELAGREVLRASRGKRRDTAVIVVTTYPDRFTRTQADKMGAFAYLERINHKTPVLEAFQAEVRRALDRLRFSAAILAKAWFEETPGPTLEVGVPRQFLVTMCPNDHVSRTVAFRGVVSQSLEVLLFSRNATVAPSSRQLPVAVDRDVVATFAVTPTAEGPVEVECVLLVKGEPLHRLVVGASAVRSPVLGAEVAE